MQPYVVVGSTRKVLRSFVCLQTNMNLLAYPVLVGILLLGVVCEAQAMFQLVTNEKNYEEAVQECNKSGSHLVLPLNETQNIELALLLPQHGKAWLYLDSPYGLITQPSAMEQMTFVTWTKSNPGPSKKMCVKIRNDQMWESADCSNKESFVCKSGPRPQTPSTLLPMTETNEPDDNNPGHTSEGHGTMRPHIETSSIAPTHRDSSLSSSITGVIIGATMAVLAVIAALVVGVYIMRRRSVSRSSTGGDEPLSAENPCNTYEEVEPSFVPDIKDPVVGQGNEYTSVNLDPANAVNHYQALYSPGTDAYDVSAVVQDNDLYSPGTDANDVSAVVQDNDLYSPGTDANDVSAVVQDNDLYSPGSDANDVSTVVQDNDLYSPVTDVESVNAMITESSHGIDRYVDGISIADNELYSSENDPQPAPVYFELLPLQDATD